MSRKRRMFEIEIPESEAESFPAGKVPGNEPRRGPMASAISESAESSRERAKIESEIRKENDTLAQEHVRLKRAGLITDMLPLDVIDATRLVRDRSDGDDRELPELVASIRDIGLSNPIRVEPSVDGRYELIQGWRRLSAYRELLKETGDEERWGKIPAGIIARGDALEMLYRRMVDENMVRKDISFAEMAQLAVRYAKDPETAEHDADKAVATLFKSAGYQKRSYIRRFIPVVEQLGSELQFSQDIPRSLGLTLANRLEANAGVAAAILCELKGMNERTASEELDLLRRYAEQGEGADSVSSVRSKGDRRAPSGKAKTTFQLNRPQGNAKCIAANGRLEIRLSRDFSTVDRLRLEAAVADLLDQLD